MKKLFISMPMNGKSREDIEFDMKIAKEAAEAELGEECELLPLNDMSDDKNPLQHLGESLIKLGSADVVFFCGGWEDARGCRIEHLCVEAYGIPAKVIEL